VLLQSQLAQIPPTSLIISDTGQRMMSAADRLKDLKSQLAAYKARYAPNHPDIITTQREVEGLEKEVQSDDTTGDLLRQLKEARDQLASAKEKYAPEHPDVVRLTRAVTELEKEVAAAPTSATLRQGTKHPDNPAYIQVQGELDSVSVERESAVQLRDALRVKLEDYERRLAQSPAVERGYRELARDLDSAQLKYEEIRSKQTESQVSENLEMEHKGERFTMIEPPLPPEKPISPPRFLMLVAGFVLSLGGGVGAILMRDKLDASVRGVQDMRALLMVPPLAAIPRIVTQAEKRKHRRAVRYGWAGALASVSTLLVVVHFLLVPLDVLWLAMLRRFGL
jgi:polysaccharide biosynthesis transport protein